jgi:hypothetical protein
MPRLNSAERVSGMCVWRRQFQNCCGPTLSRPLPTRKKLDYRTCRRVHLWLHSEMCNLASNLRSLFTGVSHHHVWGRRYRTYRRTAYSGTYRVICYTLQKYASETLFGGNRQKCRVFVSLHSNGMATEGVENVGGPGEVEHHLGRARVLHTINLN